MSRLIRILIRFSFQVDKDLLQINRKEYIPKDKLQQFANLNLHSWDKHDNKHM